MIETMHDAPGVGLAANQVGVQKRLFVYDKGDGPHVVVNPVIVETSGEWVYEEGCLSVPGLSWEIVRPNAVHLKGFDLDGNELDIETDEYRGPNLPARGRPPRRRAAVRATYRRPEERSEEVLAQAATHVSCATTTTGYTNCSASRCASRSSARPRPQYRRSRRWLTPATTSRSSSRGPIGDAAAGASCQPSPVKAAATRLGLRVAPSSRGHSTSVDVERGVVVAYGAHHPRAAARQGADAERPLLAAAALARGGPGAARDPRRRRGNRRVDHLARGDARHRSGARQSAEFASTTRPLAS